MLELACRLRRARELAGLNQQQARKLLRWESLRLILIEHGDKEPTETELRTLAGLYGVSLAWLKGQGSPLSVATHAHLLGVPPRDRATLIELLEAIA